jgi:hypothetical protein
LVPPLRCGWSRRWCRYDIGRIEDVHWNPWFSDNAAYLAHQTVFGTGFLIARTDWEVSGAAPDVASAIPSSPPPPPSACRQSVLNTFVFGMSPAPLPPPRAVSTC